MSNSLEKGALQEVPRSGLPRRPAALANLRAMVGNGRSEGRLLFGATENNEIVSVVCGSWSIVNLGAGNKKQCS